jgi:hypothetical protein
MGSDLEVVIQKVCIIFFSTKNVKDIRMRTILCVALGFPMLNLHLI